MCGIVGCILKDNGNVAPVLFKCISNLEYRGYDSVGLATYDNKINVKKAKGNIKSVNEKMNFEKMKGSLGIAHTRWASTGRPTDENAHPHLDESGSVAIVHNGTLENYTELKENLITKGHKFKSTTDSEVIAHLIRENINKGNDLEHALRKTAELLKGSYAIVAISDAEEKIAAIRKDSPLILGFGKKGYYVASDTPAILEYARDIIRPEEGEIAVLDKNGIEIHDENDNVIERKTTRITWTPEMAKKEGYDHFMIKEIIEQSQAVKNTLGQKDKIKKVLERIGEIKRISFVACGTSYHASITGKYLIESFGGIPCDVVIASEFRYTAKTWDEDTLVVFISQSGETADSRLALKQARKTSKTLAIVNVAGSAMCDEAEFVIQTQAGPEIGVAATKTYIAQLTAIYMLAGLISEDDKLISELYNVPKYINEVTAKRDEIKNISKRYDFADNAFYLGRGFSYPIALEGALKLKEITYIHAEGYAAGELKHGPLALINENVPVIIVAPQGDDYDKTRTNLEEVKARGAIILTVGCEGDEKLAKNSKEFIGINPKVEDILAPLVYIVPLQLISYYVTLDKGYNPDQPRNLAKVITV
ncbi:glutamine--fructose-6-phosphate transaminase (isomerizing) [Methanobrevibacter sp.]|uniref:glutamine--fructose-6-phosphate transaminase (isomerizing) n=1 Tax=Methanobrevibacter sp. TaxID=66852 RepID=UPI00388D4ED9